MHFLRLIVIGVLLISCNKDIHDEDILNRLPEDFNLQVIPNKANDVDLLPKLSWQKSVDKDDDEITYTIFLDKESNPKNIIASNLQQTSYTLTESLEYSTTYYWKVEAKDEGGGVKESNEIFSFTTKEENLPPNPFKLEEIADGQEEVILTPILKWETASDPNEDEVTYRLYLDDKEDPEEVLFDKLSKNEYEIKEPLQEGTTYYWKVEAIDEEGLSIFSETVFSFTTVKKNTPPIAFDLLTPLNEAAEIDLLPTFTWEQAEDTEGDIVTYSLLLGENPQPSAIIEQDIETNTFTLKNALKEFNTYYWKVVATDSRGLSVESNQVFSFTTKKITGTIGGFSLIAVENEAIEVTLTPDLRWEEAADANGGKVVYDIFLGKDQNPQTKIAGNIEINEYTISADLDEFTTYYWKVVAKDEQGLTRDSNQIYRFTTKKITGTIDGFDLISPENQGPAVSLTPDLGWAKAVDALGGKVVYDVFLGTAVNPISKIASDIEENEFKVTTPLAELTTYYWKVVAKDEQGLQKESNQIFSFTTKKVTETLGSFNLIAPEQNALEISLKPELSWEAAVDSQGGEVVYDVYVGIQENPETKIAQGITATTFSIVDPLEELTTYYWKIVAVDDQGLTKDSNQVHSFTTKKVTTTLNAFNLISPELNVADVSLTPELVWEASEDSQGGTVVYDVYIGTEQTPDIKVAQDLEAITFLFTNPLQDFTTYYWKVVAKDEQGLELESNQIFSFTTKKNNTSPAAFQLIGVTNNAEGVDLLPVFSWEPSTDPDGDELRYTVYLDQNPDPQTVLASGLNDTEYRTVDRLHLLEKYYWKVKVEDGNGGEYTSDVFTFTTRSLIGEIKRVTENAPFGIRTKHTMTVFKDKLWIIGGDDDIDEEYDDVWSSADGENWVLEVANAPFGPRQQHETIVYDGKLWVIGGREKTTIKKDVWYSENGRDWIQAAEDTPFGGFIGFSAITFNNRMWVFDTFAGGGSSSNQAWSSNDGVNWINEANNLPFGPRSGFSVNYFNNKLWLIAGGDNQDFNDIWSSADGRSWKLEKQEAEFSKRYEHYTVEMDGKLWLIAGWAVNGNYHNDIWCSKNILDWDLYKDNNDSSFDFAKGAGYQAAVFNNRIWLTGGVRNNSIVAEIWSIK